MSQTKLAFKATKAAKPTSAKAATPLPPSQLSIKSVLTGSPGQHKRKYVSSPDSPTVSEVPKTGHTRAKSKRIRRNKIPSTTCKTLLDYLSPEVDVGSEPPTESSTTFPDAQAECLSTNEQPLDLQDKSTSPPSLPVDTSAKSFLKKALTQKDVVQEVEVKKTVPRTNGGRMLAAALAKKKPSVPAHKNEVIRALSARNDLCHRHVPKDMDSKAALPSKESSTNTKLTTRERFAHLIKPISPKIKPFKTLTVTSPSKSPGKIQEKPGLLLPETYKKLSEKFSTSDQVVNLLCRRLETCTFIKLQKNVQEICRKRFVEDDLAYIIGTYDTAYILEQTKGLSQIINDRTVRNQYQLTIAFNYQETEKIKQKNKTDIFNLHPSLDVKKTIDFQNSEDFTSNEYISIKEAKEKARFNDRGLISAELLERARRFKDKLMVHIRAAHQKFLSTLVPPLKIEDSKLVRWHPEFDINGLEMPPKGNLPKPPVSSRVLSATEMLETVASNKSEAPPGLNEAIEANYNKLIAEESKAEESDNGLKDLNKDLVARIREKEARKLAEKMTRNSDKDEELAMLKRSENIIRTMRVLYISAGKGSLPLKDVARDVGANPNISLTADSAFTHIKLLAKVAPTWLTVINIGKKEYLKLNRNVDITIPCTAVKDRINELLQHLY